MLSSLLGFACCMTIKRQCSYEVIVDNNPAVYSFPMEKGTTVCVHAKMKNTVVAFEKAEQMMASVYWNINGYSHFVHDIENLENVSIYDFSGDVGEMQLTAVGSSSVSFMTFAFPRECGAHRYVSGSPLSTYGLASLSRGNFMDNNEKMCVWFVSPSQFQYRIPRHISTYAFDLRNCRQGTCSPAVSRKWENVDRLSYFELDNRVDFFSSVFSFQTRRKEAESFAFDVLLDEKNFTIHQKRLLANGDKTSEEIKSTSRRGGALFLILAILVIFVAGFLIILFSLICEPPEKIEEHEVVSFIQRPQQAQQALDMSMYGYPQA